MFHVAIKDGSDWKIVTNHSLRVDAETQVQIYKDSGIAEENLKIEEEQNNG